MAPCVCCVLDHPEIYVAGDLASVTDPRTGHVLPRWH